MSICVCLQVNISSTNILLSKVLILNISNINIGKLKKQTEKLHNRKYLHYLSRDSTTSISKQPFSSELPGYKGES